MPLGCCAARSPPPRAARRQRSNRTRALSRRAASALTTPVHDAVVDRVLDECRGGIGCRSPRPSVTALTARGAHPERAHASGALHRAQDARCRQRCSPHRDAVRQHRGGCRRARHRGRRGAPRRTAAGASLRLGLDEGLHGVQATTRVPEHPRPDEGHQHRRRQAGLGGLGRREHAVLALAVATRSGRAPGPRRRCGVVAPTFGQRVGSAAEVGVVLMTSAGVVMAETVPGPTRPGGRPVDGLTRHPHACGRRAGPRRELRTGTFTFASTTDVVRT